MLSKIILVIVLIQSVAIGSLIFNVNGIQKQSKELPAKIDMLVDSSQDKPPINLNCPECPECPGCPKCPDCPESKDYSTEFKEIKKAIKNNGGKSGVYYYYPSYCQ